MLSFVADCDGENSVDFAADFDVALSEGLIEQASHLASFSHDMIQKAATESISEHGLDLLVRKLTSALIKPSMHLLQTKLTPSFLLSST